MALAAILSCSVAGVALAGTPTAAVRYAAGSPALTTAQNLAIAHWGSSPCAGQVAIVWKRQSADINAMSLWSTAGEDPYGDPSDNQDCEVDLNPAATWDWPKLCTVVMHEYGHLTGHDHDPHPGRLMSAIYTTPAPECTATADPQALVARRQSALVIAG